MSGISSRRFLPDGQPVAVGDTVRLKHSYGREAVVSSMDDDGVMVCLPIGLSYQLRGPFTYDEIEAQDAA